MVATASLLSIEVAAKRIATLLLSCCQFLALLKAESSLEEESQLQPCFYEEKEEEEGIGRGKWLFYTLAHLLLILSITC